MLRIHRSETRIYRLIPAILLLVIMIFSGQAFAAGLKQAEYFFDAVNPTPGSGLALPAVGSVTGESEGEFFLENIDVSHLSAGPHTVSVWIQDDEDRWGILTQAGFNVYEPADIIVDAEYSFDPDWAAENIGKLTAVDGAFDGPQEEAELSGVDVSGLDEGIHTLYVRFQNALGLWSAPVSRQIGINRPVAETFETPSQSMSGDGRIPVTVAVSDDGGKNCRLKVEYSLDNTTWSPCTIEESSLSATFGAPDIDNLREFQIGSDTAPITTAQGVNQINLIWLSSEDLPGIDTGNAQLRFTVDNGEPDQATSHSADSFILDNDPPDAPVIDVYQPDPTGNRRPLLTWQDAGAAVKYHIQIALDESFTQVEVDEIVVDPLFQPESDLPLGTVFWRVAGKDDQGNDSTFSTTDAIEIIEDTTAPSVALTYSDASPVAAGPLTITARFSEPLTSAPRISVSRFQSPVVSETMTGSGDTFHYTYEVLCADASTWYDGAVTVTISGGQDFAGNSNTPASNNTFQVNTTSCSSDTITAAEYFIDHDPGPGNAIELTPADGVFNENQEDIVISDLPVADLTVGPHTVYVRFKRADGKWGLARPMGFDSLFAGPHNFIVEGEKQVSAAEYFIDSDPGVGMGTPLEAVDGAFDSPEEDLILTDVDVSHLMPGPHTLYVRIQDNDGRWGILSRTRFNVYGEPDAFVAAEYFLDTDPGQGLGTPLNPVDGSFDSIEESGELIDVDVLGLDDGVHTLFVRFRNALGRWSEPVSRKLGINVPVADALKTPSQALSGDGRVPVAVDISDADGRNCTLKVEYSLDNTNWSLCTIDPSSLTADHGAPDVDNAREFQIGSVAAPIETSLGTNRIGFVWLSGEDLPGVDTGDAQLRFTVDNGQATQTTSHTTDTFTLDNDAPDAPVINIYSPDPTGSRRPVLTWQDASAAVEYRIQIASDFAFIERLVDEIIIDPIYQPLTDLPAGTIFWRVAARDDQGNESRFSSADVIDIITDTTSPSVTLTYSEASPVTAGPLVITAKFSEPLAGEPDITISRPGTETVIAPMTGSGALWQFTWQVHCADGTTWLDGLTTVTVNGIDWAGLANTPAANNTFTVDTSACAGLAIAAAEYFIDHDPGPGNAIALDPLDGAFDSVEEEIEIADLPVDHLTSGPHTVFVRFKTTDGHWGLARPMRTDPLFSSPHNFVVEGEKWIAAAEYYIDSDPGLGQGTSLGAVDGLLDSNQEELVLPDIDVSHLMPGLHTLYLRVQDNEGTWGVVRQTRFTIYEEPDAIVAAEYFFDTDPGTGMGIPLPAKDGAYDGPEEEAELSGVDISGLSEGVHTLYVRFLNALGRWSAPMEQPVGINRPVVYAKSGQVLLETGSSVPLTVIVDDAANAACALKVDYSLDDSGEWQNIAIEEGSLTASSGSPALDNDADYQIGGASGAIDTASGPNELSFNWVVDEINFSGATRIVLRFTVDNGTYVTSSRIEIDPGLNEFIDTIPPVISDLKYNNVLLGTGSVVTRPGSFTFMVSDAHSDMGRVLIYINGKLVGTFVGKAGLLTQTWDIADVDDGLYTITIEAYDRYDNMQRHELSNLEVKLAPPLPPVPDTNLDGVIISRNTLAVTGTATPNTFINVYNNGVLVAGNVLVDSSGKFTVVIPLVLGDNSIQIGAENRSGESELTAVQTVIQDPNALRTPLGFEAASKPLGVIRLAWGQLPGEIPAGYHVYRSQTSFSDLSDAERITAQPTTRLVYEDLPEMEGTYFYRVTSVDVLGNESEETSEKSAVSDAVPPVVSMITYETDGVVDEPSQLFGPGTITLTLDVSEPLTGIPFLSLNMAGGNPIPITLSKADELTWTGSFTVEPESLSGQFFAVFSGKDAAGNPGTLIEQGSTLDVDAIGPSVTLLEISPASPVKNDSADPVEITVTISLDEEIKSETEPYLTYLLSGEDRILEPVENWTQIDTLPNQAQTWQGSFILPGDAGSWDGESFYFNFQATDALDNPGQAILAPNNFQVYQGDLPPLAVPDTLTAESLSNGRIQLTWNSVDDAAGYQLYRQGSNDTTLLPFTEAATMQFLDQPAVEGEYMYAVASIRRFNGQETISGMSAPVTATADATAPPVPQDLVLELKSNGIHAFWTGSDTDPAAFYRLYRSSQDDISSIATLSPVVDNIQTLETVDAHPSATHHTYAVTAVDEAGNESDPSVSTYLNFELLPVADLAVVQINDENPVITWNAEGSSIAGFDIYLGKGTDGVKLNNNLLTSPVYTDEGYSNDERTYTVVAVDTDGHESLGRTVVLPKVAMALQEDETLHRNLMNRLTFQVENLSSSTIENAVLEVDVNGYTGHQSDIFELSAQQSALIPVVMGGHADLPDYADYSLSLVSTPNPGETATITRTGQIEVVNDSLVAGILSDNWIRGGIAQVWFTLDNTGEETVEIITAKGSGTYVSPDIRVQLTDTDGNILSESQLKQSQGGEISTLNDGTSIARIDAGKIFTSAAIDLAVPVNAPDDVKVNLFIDQVYHDFGQTNAIVLSGLTTHTEISVSEPPYTGEIISIAPIDSDGSENITITGQALARETGAPVPFVPVKLVIYQDGFEKTYNVYTGTDGRFIHTYYPSDSEYGTYQVRAVHPAVNHGISQGEFSIQRVSMTPDSVNLHLIHNHPKTATVSVLGGFNTPANNLRLEYRPEDQSGGDLPQGVTVDLPPAIATLDPQTTQKLTVSVWGDNTVDPNNSIVLNLASDENDSWGKLRLSLYFSEPQPSLYFSPNYVETGLAVDEIISERITLKNRGTGVMSNLSLSVHQQGGAPAPDWVVLNGSSDLGDLAVGEEKDVDISFAPQSGIAEGIYQFMLRVAADNYADTDINLFVSVSQSGIGHVLFKVSDIYTGTIDPDTEQEVFGLAGAKITIQNENVASIKETLTTDTQGEALFSDLSTGLYKCRITAGDHQQYIGRFWVRPGMTVTRDIFLDYNLVSVVWEVVETTIQDQYTVKLSYVFETQVDVPAAVLTIEPASTHLPDMQPGDVYNGEITIINHGLIQAENVTYTPPSDNQTYKYEFFGKVPDILSAKSSFKLPFRVTRVGSTTDDESGGALTRCNINRATGRTKGTMTCINGTLRPVSATNEFVDSGEWCDDFVEDSEDEVEGSTSGEQTYTSISGDENHCQDDPDECPQDESYECCCQQKGTCENVDSSVNLLSGKYVYHDTDLSISVPGHSISTTRRYYNGVWHFNHKKNRLDLDLVEGPSSTRTVYKDGVAYEETESGSNLFSYKDKYFIQSEADGYRWNDRKGNWMIFDAEGKALAYGDRYNQSVKYIYDTADTDRLVGMSDTNDRQVLWYEYQGDHISAVEDIAGRRISYTYDGDNLVDVTDVMDNHWKYTYDSGDRLTSKTTPLGGTTSISYYGDGFVKSVTTSTGASKYFDYSYNSSTHEYYAQITHSSGMVDERWYNSKGKAIKKAINGVVQKSVSYNNNIRTSVASGGQQTEEELDQWEQITKTTYADGSSVSYEYDPETGNLLRQTNELGVITEYDYDENGNMIRMTEAVGTDVERATEYAYDDVGRLIETRRLGDAVTAEAVTTMTYDADGNLATQTDPEGGVTQYLEYDALGNVLEKLDARGKLWQYSYDTAGQLLSMTDPLDHVTLYEYDAAGNQTKVIDANKHATNYTFDDHGRMTSMTDAEGGITRYEYDQFGQQTKVIDAEGKITVRNEYDVRGRLIRTIDGNDNVIENIYAEESDSGCSSCSGGDEGQLVATVYPTFERQYVYDKRGRKILDIDVMSENESQTVYEYDGAGNRVKVVDKGGRKTSYEYDALNRMVTTVDAAGGRTESTYDSRDNIVALSDANGNTTSFEYDRNNRLINEIRPMGDETTYSYDALGNLVERLDAKDQITIFIYDDAGRRTEIKYYLNIIDESPIKTVVFTYDNASNLLSYDDGTSSANYVYDNNNLKISETVDYGNFSLCYSYSYYANGLKHTFTSPGGITYTYTYDANNQLSSINIPDSGNITYQNNVWNWPTLKTLPSGTIEKYTYDQLMRINRITVEAIGHDVIMDYAYTFDPSGNIIQKQTEHGTYTYGYDELDRLTSADNPNITDEAFTYDPVGNRLTSADTTNNWAYNKNSELEGFDNTKFEYNSNGSMIQLNQNGSILNFFYNVNNRLVAIKDSENQIAGYYYDPFGRRLWKDVHGSRTYFYYSDDGLTGEYDADGNPVKIYGWHPTPVLTTGPVFMNYKGKNYFYHNDQLGSPQIMSSTVGNVWKAEYSAYGEAIVKVETIENNLRFPGQYFDEELSMNYNWHRYYEPSFGRYTRIDPIGVKNTDHLYTYASNNPIRNIDIDGKKVLECLGSVPIHRIIVIQNKCNDNINLVAGFGVHRYGGAWYSGATSTLWGAAQGIPFWTAGKIYRESIPWYGLHWAGCREIWSDDDGMDMWVRKRILADVNDPPCYSAAWHNCWHWAGNRARNIYSYNHSLAIKAKRMGLCPVTSWKDLYDTLW
nr:RHS repeat-associated core domain-containing protein [uncultured Desulfobacter sp.]